MKLLRSAVTAREPEGCTAVLDTLMARGIASETIADELVPRLARELGEAWCEDEKGFAEVTIGAARLQSLVRKLGAGWGSDPFGAPDGPTLLLAVPRDVHHTLGAVVLAGQMRRRGCSVRLVLGATADELAHQMAQARYDAVLISASDGSSIESLRILVGAVRQAAGPAPRIVIGGTILETDEDVCALTGADHATSDPEEALRLCDLESPTHDTSLSAQAG